MKISYVITVFNKAPYIADVIRSLANEHSEAFDAVEYIFVDDGSSDNSIEIIRENEALLPGKLVILEQENLGAAVATNAGVDKATHDWVRLLDGDDIVCQNSTAAMYALAQENQIEFVLGSYGYFSKNTDLLPQIEIIDAVDYVVMDQEECLKRFIKNFTHNSSCMLFKKTLFQKFSGADTRLMSPDYTIALRAVANTSKIILLHNNVSQMIDEAPGRLSSQIGRSRYDSIMAIYYLAHELLPERRDIAVAVYKRACSRSYRYSRLLKNRPLWHYLRYVRSKTIAPLDLGKATYRCLSAYTPDGKPERPKEWAPGYKV